MQSPMQTKRVLVVDDQTPVRELVAAVLASDGHSVETARDGADALRLLDSSKRYDLIVSDLKMPGLDGPSLYLELTRRWPDTRPHLLFISGFVDSPEYSGFLQGTQVQVLLKPFAVDDLSRAVSGLLGQS
jgi:CheY-like chemotaxis protein